MAIQKLRPTVACVAWLNTESSSNALNNLTKTYLLMYTNRYRHLNRSRLLRQFHLYDPPVGTYENIKVILKQKLKIATDGKTPIWMPSLACHAITPGRPSGTVNGIASTRAGVVRRCAATPALTTQRLHRLRLRREKVGIKIGVVSGRRNRRALKWSLHCLSPKNACARISGRTMISSVRQLRVRRLPHLQ